MRLGDLPAQRQAKAGAGAVAPQVQALERLEQPCLLLG